MIIIIPGIINLKHYVELTIAHLKYCTKCSKYSFKCKLCFERRLRVERCKHCNHKHLHSHGSYPRKCSRSKSGESLNPIFIYRFLCIKCGRTTSLLPECIAPRRWYLWSKQETVIKKNVNGESLRSISTSTGISRATCRRWLQRFRERFKLQRDAICNQFIELGRSIDFKGFWKLCLGKISLSKAMFICHQSEVSIP